MITSEDETFSYHYDGTGNTVAITDESKQVQNTYAYTPFGVITENEVFDQPFTFSGEYGVIQDSTGLYYMRARYYDPLIGRFISEDPIRFEGGDVNLYAYTGNNPINFADPWGLSSEGSGWGKIRNWASDHSYLDIGVTGLAPGTLGPVLNLGVIFSSDGIYWYHGFGLGGGAGASVTGNLGTPPSPGIVVTGTLRGGTGVWGGHGTFGASVPSGSAEGALGGGWGIGRGAAITATDIIRIFSWRD